MRGLRCRYGARKGKVGEAGNESKDLEAQTSRARTRVDIGVARSAAHRLARWRRGDSYGQRASAEAGLGSIRAFIRELGGNRRHRHPSEKHLRISSQKEPPTGPSFLIHAGAGRH